MALVRMDADPAGLAAHWADHIGMVVLKNPGYTFSAHFTADQAREVGRQLIAAADRGDPQQHCAKCGRTDHPMADEHADGTLCDRACGHDPYVEPGTGRTEGYCVDRTCPNFYAVSDQALRELYASEIEEARS